MSDTAALLARICSRQPAAVALIGRDLRVHEASPAALALFGRADDDSSPWPLDRLIEPRSATALGNEVMGLLADGGDRPGTVLELTARRRDGRAFQLEASLCPVRDGDDGWILGTFDDLTEAHRLAAQASLVRRLDSVGHLAAGIAHEINTPVQYLGDNTHFLSGAFGDLLAIVKDLATQVDLTPRQREEIAMLRAEVPQAVEQSLDGIRRVGDIISAMREFSHPDSERVAEVDLTRTVRSAVAVARNEWRYVADVVLDLDEGLHLVACNQAEISQVLLNLVVNAAQAIQEGGKDEDRKGVITIRTRRSGTFADIRITDTGCGIPEWAQDRIFEAFFTTKPPGRGTGQGLTISRSVVTRAGGTLEFHSQAGRGTTFVVRLPLAGSE